jgi:hypothetical protein
VEKLVITPLGADNQAQNAGRIVVQFNPTNYSIDKRVTWKPVEKFGFRDAPWLEYGTSSGRTLVLDLFFDVSEPLDPRNPDGFTDVRQLTGKLVALTRRSQKGGSPGAETMTPPFIRIDWGGAGPKNSDFPFIGAVDSLKQSFTMFSADGRPLRATVNLGITESSDPAQDKLLDSGSFEQAVKTDANASLARLSNKYTGQSADWRKIAEANKIDDPLSLPTGRYLKLPAGKLERG